MEKMTNSLLWSRNGNKYDLAMCIIQSILQGTVKGTRGRGRQEQRSGGKVKTSTGMDFGDTSRAAEHRTRWKGIFVRKSVVPKRLYKGMRLN